MVNPWTMREDSFSSIAAMLSSRMFMTSCHGWISGAKRNQKIWIPDRVRSPGRTDWIWICSPTTCSCSFLPSSVPCTFMPWIIGKRLKGRTQLRFQQKCRSLEVVPLMSGCNSPSSICNWWSLLAFAMTEDNRSHRGSSGPKSCR